MTDFLLWFAVTVFFTFLVVVIVSYFQSRQILRPSGYKKPLDFYPDAYNLVYESVDFTTRDNISLKGWFIPYKGKSDRTIILLHGWGNNKADVLKNVYFLNDLGFNLFCFDFRCCGESKGEVSSVGYLETLDFRAAMEFLKTYKPSESKRVGIYSISMGASVAIYCAKHYDEIKCILAEAVFDSYEKVVARWAWVRMKVPYFPCVPLTLFFVRLKLKTDPEKFSPLYHIGKVSPKPIFFIHASLDNLVLAESAEKLFEKASNPKSRWLVVGASHGKCAEVGGHQYKKRVSDFFIKNL